jgi:hypothetical protein
LQKQTAGLGLTVREDGQHGLSGQAEKIRAKWWLGGRKVDYRMSCRLTEPDHIAHFREAVVERSWGIPPPTLTVETTSVSGWKRSGELTMLRSAAAHLTTQKCVTQWKRQLLPPVGNSS